MVSKSAQTSLRRSCSSCCRATQSGLSTKALASTSFSQGSWKLSSPRMRCRSSVSTSVHCYSHLGLRPPPPRTSTTTSPLSARGPTTTFSCATVHVAVVIRGRRRSGRNAGAAYKRKDWLPINKLGGAMTWRGGGWRPPSGTPRGPSSSSWTRTRAAPQAARPLCVGSIRRRATPGAHIRRLADVLSLSHPSRHSFLRGQIFLSFGRAATFRRHLCRILHCVATRTFDVCVD